MPFAVGLTGGIGSGKTTVAELFARLGAGVIDTDQIARELTAAGQPTVKQIAQRFGPDYVTADGTLDRVRMRALVFADSEARKDLEAILHPLIRDESMRRIADTSAPYVIVVVPLLLETGAYRTMVRRVVVADCDEETQIERVMRRSQLTREEVLAIMASQVSRAERLLGADDVISNNDDFAVLAIHVAALHGKYLALAAKGRYAL
jgi:dephospho-CoA kinase